MTYIISYPRSGNTALRYLIELLTGQPTNGVCGPPNSRDHLQQPLIHKGRTDFIAHKRHDFRGVKPSDAVLFIIRDPLEAVLRHNKPHREVTLAHLTAWLDGWFALYRQALERRAVIIDYDRLVQLADRASRDIYRGGQSTGPDYHKKQLPSRLLVKANAHIERLWGDLLARYPTAPRVPAAL